MPAVPLTSTALLGLAFAATAAWAGITQIDQVGQKFSLSSISIQSADHVKFLNQDDVQHNIKIIDAAGDEDDKGLQKPGETIDVAFGKTGRFMVRCAIHPKMKMAVEVR
jgi:plastocyanin